MITLREYEAEDWTKIDDAVEPFMLVEPLEDFNKVAQRGLAVTAVEDGNVMACGGVAYINHEEGIVWVKVSEKCLEQSYGWARTIRETFRIMMKSLGSMTIITYILTDFCKGEKLARLIGMKKTDKTYEYNGNIYNKYAVMVT